MTLREVLNRFFDRMNYLNGLLHHLETQLNLFRDDIQERIATGDARELQFAAGSSLVIRDLTEWPSHGWAVYYPSGGFSTQGDEFLALVDQLISREATWTISQAFEAFETCLKDLLAAHYLVNPGAAIPEELRKQERKLEKAGLDRNRFDFWAAYVRRTYRSSDKVLIVIRQTAPQIDDAEQRNNYPIDLIAWFKIVSEVRHAAVHSNLIISKSLLSELSEDEQKLLDDSVAGAYVSNGYELKPTVKQANAILTRLTEYGYAVFKALSIAGGTDWHIFNQQGKQ